MLKRQKHILISLGCLIVCMFAQAGSIGADGLEKYLNGLPLAVGSVRFVPVTIRDGMESQKSPLWPLRNPSKVFESPAYLKNEPRALDVGIDLKERMDDYSVAGYKNNSFYFLFYNFITAAGCPNEYVIQKTRLEKSYYDVSGNSYKKEEQYLVEALALNLKKETKRADEHWKEYLLGKFHSRKIVIDLQIGCGEIPKVIQGKAWPYAENSLYYRIQDYSSEPGFYNKVNFSFSSKYRMTMEFDRDGKYSLDLPYSK